jgi:hypothetical protein
LKPAQITSVFLEIAENCRFFAIFSPKIYVLLGYILESAQIPANTSTEQIETPLAAFFFQISTPNSKYKFLKVM